MWKPRDKQVTEITRTFDIDAGLHYYEVEVEMAISLESEQKGGTTDPSWPAYLFVDGYEIKSVRIWSDVKDDMVDSYTYLFDNGEYYRLLENEIDNFEP